MAVSSIEALLPYPVETVWRVVTDCARCNWRSDLERVVLCGEDGFTEYTKSGYTTRFTITEATPCRYWALHLENDNLSGDWTGVFEARDGGSRIAFTERVTVKKFWMRPFVGPYLKRQQALYLRDLKKALENA